MSNRRSPSSSSTLGRYRLPGPPDPGLLARADHPHPHVEAAVRGIGGHDQRRRSGAAAADRRSCRARARRPGRRPRRADRPAVLDDADRAGRTAEPSPEQDGEVDPARRPARAQPLEQLPSAAARRRARAPWRRRPARATTPGVMSSRPAGGLPQRPTTAAARSRARRPPRRPATTAHARGPRADTPTTHRQPRSTTRCAEAELARAAAAAAARATQAIHAMSSSVGRCSEPGHAAAERCRPPARRPGPTP